MTNTVQYRTIEQEGEMFEKEKIVLLNCLAEKIIIRITHRTTTYYNATMTKKVEYPVDKAALEEMSRGMVSKGIGLLT